MAADDCVDEVIEALVTVIREELPPMIRANRNWKFIFSGSAGGDVQAASEQHAQVVRRYKVLGEQTQ